MTLQDKEFQPDAPELVERRNFKQLADLVSRHSIKLGQQPWTNEVSPLGSERVALTNRSMPVFLSPAFTKMRQIAQKWNKAGQEVPIALWGTTVNTGKGLVYIIEETSEVFTPDRSGAHIDLTDVSKLRKETETRFFKGQDFIGLIHLHPTKLGRRLAGRFSNIMDKHGFGDFPAMVDQSFTGEPGSSLTQPFVAGVITDASERDFPHIGTYVFNQAVGQTSWRGGKINGRVEKCAGYFVVDKDSDVLSMEFFDPQKGTKLGLIGKWEGGFEKPNIKNPHGGRWH